MVGQLTFPMMHQQPSANHSQGRCILAQSHSGPYLQCMLLLSKVMTTIMSNHAILPVNLWVVYPQNWPKYQEWKRYKIRQLPYFEMPENFYKYTHTFFKDLSDDKALQIISFVYNHIPARHHILGRILHPLEWGCVYVNFLSHVSYVYTCIYTS